MWEHRGQAREGASRMSPVTSSSPWVPTQGFEGELATPMGWWLRSKFVLEVPAETARQPDPHRAPPRTDQGNRLPPPCRLRERRTRGETGACDAKARRVCCAGFPPHDSRDPRDPVTGAPSEFVVTWAPARPVFGAADPAADRCSVG